MISIKRMIMFCCIAIACVKIGPVCVAAEPAEELLRQCERAFEREEFERAIALIDQVLANSPDHHPALILKARCLARLDLRADALEILDRILAKNPENRDALLAKGSNLARLGKPEEAADLFRQIINNDPHDALALYNLGASLKDSSRLREAIDYFLQAEKEFPRRMDEYTQEARYMLSYQLGLCYMGTQRFEEAIERFHRAHRAQPWRENACYQLGLAYMRLKKTDEGKEWMDRFNRIVSVQKKIRMAERLIAQSPESATPYLAIGQLHFSLQDWPHAELFFEKALERESRNTTAMNYLGLVYVQQNQYDKAGQFFMAVLEIEENLQALVNLGSLSMQQGKWKDAEGYFLKALSINPTYQPAIRSLQNLELMKAQNK